MSSSEDKHLITVSPSEILTMRQCPLKHWIQYGERWTKPQTETSALGLGTIWHSVMEAHRRALKAGGDLDKAIDAAFNVIDEIVNEEVKSTISWMYEGYIRYYGADEDWDVIDIEMAAELELPAPRGWPEVDLVFRLKIKIDLFYKYKRRIWVLDEKSCKNLPKKMELDLDDQFGLYYWAGTQLGYPVFGAVHSASRKVRLKTKEAPLNERFLRQPTVRRPDELQTIAEEAWQTAYFTYLAAQRVMEAKRAGAKVEHRRHTHTQECGWKCDFTEVCLLSRKGANRENLLIAQGYRQDYSRH